MATLSAYLKQYTRRTRRAIRNYGSADKKVRRYAEKLREALLKSDEAANQLNRINQLYLTDFALRTLFVKAIADQGLIDSIGLALGSSTPGEEVQLFNLIGEGNNGQALADELVFGEVVASTPITPPLGNTLQATVTADSAESMKAE